MLLDNAFSLIEGHPAGVMKAMAWKTMDVEEQRVRFVVEATQKRSSFLLLAIGATRLTTFNFVTEL